MKTDHSVGPVITLNLDLALRRVRVDDEEYAECIRGIAARAHAEAIQSGIATQNENLQCGVANQTFGVVQKHISASASLESLEALASEACRAKRMDAAEENPWNYRANSA